MEVIEWLERMKEVQRIQYDYCKHLITLGTGSILILIAFLEKVFANPETWILVVFYGSIVGFTVTIIFSLYALPNTGNTILYVNGLQRAVMENNEEKKKEFNDKIDIALDSIGIFSRGAYISYTIGIAMLLIGAGLYFFLN